MVGDEAHPSFSRRGREKSDEPPTQYKGMRPLQLIPILVQAIQEQQAIIEKLQNKIKNLESKVY